MKLDHILFGLSIGLPLLVSAQTTIVATQTVEVTQVSTVLSTPSQTTDTLPTKGVGADVSSEPPSESIDPNEAGASGEDDGAFTISKGGLIAIITVVSIVAVFGIVSLVLWYLAKKRSWEVRASLRRVSRRLTGRLDDSKSKRQSRRTGIRMQSPPRPRKERDLEKGRPIEERRKPSLAPESNGKTTTTINSTFEMETPVAKSFKSKLFNQGSSNNTTTR